MTNHWWKAHNGITSDAKLYMIAHCSSNRKGEVLAVWIILLDYASQNVLSRGSVSGLSNEQICFMTDFDGAKVESIMGEFRRRGMIDEFDTLIAWDKRQGVPTDPTNAERQKRFREKQRTYAENIPLRNAVTEHNALRNTEEKRREEKRREEKPPCSTSVEPESSLALFETILGFDDWWRVYWNKTAKMDAEKAFAIASKRFGVQFLIDEAIKDKNRSENHEAWTWRSKLLGATWLRGKRWEDQLPAPVYRNNGSKSPSTADRVLAKMQMKIANGENPL